MEPILIAILAFSGGLSAFYGYNKLRSRKPVSPKPEIDSKIPDIETAKDQSKTVFYENKEILIEAKDEAFRIKKEAEAEARKIREQVLELEKRLALKEESLERKLLTLEDKEKALERDRHELKQKTEEAEKLRTDLINKLEKTAAMTREEAKKLIIDAVDGKLKDENARRIKEAEEFIKQEADKKAKEVLVESMQRGATDYVAEYTTTRVKLPDNEMKGRIIGKEGRNIRAFEVATGVDVEIDETPGEITLSSFDGERREVAKVSLERLIADGRIQPSRIEEIVERTRSEFEKVRRAEGEKLAATCGVHTLPPEVLDALGKFKWRFSYGQSLIVHTMEETRIGVHIAQELKLNVNKVRLGCLLHDIGKAFTPEVEGSHVRVGADFARRAGIPEEVVNIIEEHHEDKPFSSLESVVVWISDAISGSRPGARQENVEDYVKRLSELETIAKSFKGVEKSFAIQSGREVRVVVVPSAIDDSNLTILAHDIAQKIHDTVVYPGQVKVTVIRETRAVDVAT